MKRSLLFIVLLNSAVSSAQIPVEIFGGHQKSTVDVMFFKYFKTKEGKNSPFLFFNRNRASIDYRMTSTEYLPVLGFTEAISYNHPKLKGVAPVLVGQVLSWAVYPKAGIQYAYVKPTITVFTWVVTETLANPTLDYFILARYTPKFGKRLGLFLQGESLSAFPTEGGEQFRFTQRVRLGMSIDKWQLGAGADFQQAGRNSFDFTYNVGGFIRHEF